MARSLSATGRLNNRSSTLVSLCSLRATAQAKGINQRPPRRALPSVSSHPRVTRHARVTSVVVRSRMAGCQNDSDSRQGHGMSHIPSGKTRHVAIRAGWSQTLRLTNDVPVSDRFLYFAFVFALAYPRRRAKLWLAASGLFSFIFNTNTRSYFPFVLPYAIIENGFIPCMA